MDLLFTLELGVPLHQIALLLILSTTALLWGKMKIALLINYIFTLYWGYFFNRDLFGDYIDEAYPFYIVYFGLGIFVVIMAMIGFISQREQ